MRTQFVYVQGKAKWVRVRTPDQFGKYSMNLYPDAKSLEIIKNLKEKKIIGDKIFEGIKNKIRRDEDGDFVQFGSPMEKLIKGTKRFLPPPDVLDKDGQSPLRESVGNGSDVTVKLEVYRYNVPAATTGGTAARLLSIRVDNLVTYQPKLDTGVHQSRSVKGFSQIDPAEPVF